MAQDDYYYEIQLSNKQLVFYFMAGATGLILSFLAGVMVGRGVDAGAAEVQAARTVPVQEEKVVAEEAPARPSPPPAENLTYAQRLEGEKQDETLEKGKPAPGVAPPALRPATAPTRAPKPAASPTSAPKPAVASPTPKQTAPAPVPAAAAAKPGPAPKAVAATVGTFTIQVGAFKDKATADSIASSLKNKGFSAYVVGPGAEGLFNVLVGSYASRADAEHVQVRLRDEQNFKPYIRKN